MSKQLEDELKQMVAHIVQMTTEKPSTADYYEYKASTIDVYSGQLLTLFHKYASEVIGEPIKNVPSYCFPAKLKRGSVKAEIVKAGGYNRAIKDARARLAKLTEGAEQRERLNKEIL